MINRRLYDLIIRHQVYVEGFKNYQKEKFVKELPKLLKTLREEFRKIPFKLLDSMTKKELLEFQRGIKQVNKEFFDYWNNLLKKDLDAFIDADFYLTKAILENHLKTSLKDSARKEDENKIVPFAWIFDDEKEKLKKFIYLSLVSGIGVMPEDFLDNVELFTLNKMQIAINSGFSDKQTTEDILNEIIGTKDNNYKDGIFNAVLAAQNTTQNTFIQNITAIINASIFATVFDKYQWISVMDSLTSNICISRNRNVYQYGKGPLPPAHGNCRSRTAPFIFGQENPNETFTEWTKAQPEKIQNYVDKKFPALNAKEFGSKLESILTV